MSEKSEKAWHILRETMAPFILEYASNREDEFGIVSIVDVKVSKEYSYADFYVTCQTNLEDLPKYLAKFAWEIKSMIGRELWARKSPNIRFKIATNVSGTWDLLSLINELSKEYGLSEKN